MNALRCLAANDEICKEICEAGGIVLFMENFDRNLRVESLVKPACITMRQLACSDTVKVEIMKHDGARIFSQYAISGYGKDNAFHLLVCFRCIRMMERFSKTLWVS